MISLRVAVCDDERAALDLLVPSIGNAFRARKVDVTVRGFTRAQDVLNRMETDHYNLLFLDIEMPGMSGLELARKLRKAGNLVDIIYISNREDLVFEALRTNPRGFIRKSRLIQDVTSTIASYLAYRENSAQPKSLVIHEQGQAIQIPIEKLQYIEGSGKTQIAHVAGQKDEITLHNSMQNLEEELSKEGFLRIHKGYLLNYRFIRRISDNEVILTSGGSLPISRRKYQEIRDAYMELMQKEGDVIL